MAPVLHVRLLGDCSLRYGHAPVTEVSTPRLQALLAYLLLHRDAPQSRPYLAFQFWPDSTEAQALSNLRTLLVRLRRALPDADRFLEATAQTLQWRPDAPFRLDVAAFEEALDRAEQAGDAAAAREASEGAADLYEGDLLPGCYDDWILPHRERLRQAYLGALERLTRLLEDQRDYDGAIRHARRLLQQDPLLEAGFRRLMQLQALKGDRAAALRAYHTCAATLARELGVEPSRATQTVYEQLLRVEASEAPPALAAPDILPLVGREAEWAQMQAAWHRSARGPRFLLLLGEAGIGKSRLAEEMLFWAQRQGIADASARCYAAEGELAYAPVTALLRARPLPPLDDVWLTEVARLLPEVLAKRPDLATPRPMTETWQRTRLFEALARAMLGDGQPLLLVMDDLQWCDRESLEWLHYLLRFDAKARLMVVGTCRPEELSDDCPLSASLPNLYRDVRVTEIELGPLDEAETATLAANVAGQPLDPVLARQIYVETEGNPLFVVETVRAGLEAEDQPPPPRVQAVLGARLAQLSPPGRELAGVAATIGRSFTFPVLQAAGDGDEDALVRGLDELWRRRIVRERGADAYDFAHDKLRETAYGTLSPARRRFLHRRVAQALESVHRMDLDPVSRQVASHYRQAGVGGQAIPYYLRAGQVEGRLYAHEEAEACFRRGLELLEVGAGDRELVAQLYEGLGDALRARQPEEARQAYERALQETDRGDPLRARQPEEARQAYERALQETDRGDPLRARQPEEARQAYERALQETDRGDPLTQARLQRLIAISWYLQGQFDQTLEACDLAETLLGAVPEGQAEAWWREWLDMQLWRGGAYYVLGRWREIAEMLEQVGPVVERHGGPYERAWVNRGRTTVAMRRDRYVISEETLAYQRAGLSEIWKTGELWFVAMDQYMVGWLLVLRGELDEAERYLQDALELSKRTEYPLVQAYALNWLNVLYRKRGQVAEAEAHAARALEAATAAHMLEQVAMTQANRAWIAWRKGDLAEAEAQGLVALDSWQRGQFVHAFHWTARWPLLAVALAQERVAEALDHARAMLDPQQQQLPEAMEAALEEALQAGEAGDPEAARPHLQRAVKVAQETGYL